VPIERPTAQQPVGDEARFLIHEFGDTHIDVTPDEIEYARRRPPYYAGP
jgi:hypothetical protein